MLRRQLLHAGAAIAMAPPTSAPAPAHPAICGMDAKGDKQPPPFRIERVMVKGTKRLGDRFNLLVPSHHMEGPLRLLVALHGLGETKDPDLGLRAWLELYGLKHAYRRLHTPPIQRLNPKRRYWTDERLKGINAELLERPFCGLAVVCPFTPNVYRMPRQKTLDAYAAWLVDVVIPEACKRAGVENKPQRVSIDGCSLGGYMSAEMFLRKPETFGAWGGVQAAIGKGTARDYARRFAETIERVGPRPLHVETSTADVYRKVNQTLFDSLKKRKVPVDFRMPPGPHNQPFLRDSGTVEMLHWHDRLPR